MYWILGIVVGIFVGYILDREIYFYEGVHLGPRIQAWLYDRWSKKYDAGKRDSQVHDTEMLVHPLLHKLNDVPEPFILDFATGTGRLSFAILGQRDFKGHIVAVDLSLGMLEQAAAKIAGRKEAADVGSRPETRIEFLRHLSLPLPFADATFDAVCALEVLELFTSMDVPLKEITRVLRPGGMLLTSRGTEASGRKAKVKSKSVFTSLLEANGLSEILITPWWKLFDRVLARKGGESQPVSANGLSTSLRCGACNQVAWKVETRLCTCQSCGKTLPITADGIILN